MQPLETLHLLYEAVSQVPEKAVTRFCRHLWPTDPAMAVLPALKVRETESLRSLRPPPAFRPLLSLRPQTGPAGAKNDERLQMARRLSCLAFCLGCEARQLRIQGLLLAWAGAIIGRLARRLFKGGNASIV